MSLPATFYFSVNQAARIIATSSKTLRRLVKKGVVKPERGSKGELFFTFDDLVLLQNALSHSREERTYSVTQATRLIKVSPDTLRRWEEEGKIKPTRTPGGHRRYTASQLTKITAIKEAKREVKIPVAIPPRVEPLISSLLPSIGEIPPLYQELHPTQTRMLGIVAVVAGIVGMVFVAEKGLSISNYIPVEQIKTNLGISPAQKLISEDTAIPQVLQAATEARQVSFNVNVESTNRENATFDKDVDVTGILTVGGLTLSGSLTIPGDLGVNGGDFTTTSTTFNLVNTNATTLNIGGAATTISLGASSGTTTVNNALTVSGAGTFSSTFKASGASTLSSTLDVSGATTLSSTLKTSGKITASGDLQVDGALDVNGSGTHDIAGTLNLSGNTLTASGDLTLTPGGGDIIFSGGNTLNIGGSGSDVAYSVIGDTTSGASSSVDSDDDLYIEGNLEVDGTIVGSVSSVNPGLTTGTVFFQGASGLTGDATNFFFDDTNNRLGLGTATPGRTLDVAGSTTLGSATTDLITFTARMTSGTSLIPAVNLGSDLGSSSLYFNNIYVGTVNTNAALSSTGQALFTYDPTDTTFTQSSVLINPTAPATNELMLGVGQGGQERAGIDAEGDLSLGYSGTVTAPTSANPLTIYNHSTTEVASLSTAGALQLDGNIAIDGGNITSTSATLTLGGSITTLNCTDCIDFDDMEDTLDLDTSLTLNQTTNTWSQSFTGTTTTGFSYTGNSLTSGEALDISSSATAFTGQLLDITLSGSNAVNTGNLLRITSSGTLNATTALMVTNLGGASSTSFRVNDETGDADTTPFLIDASGNVGIGTTSPSGALDIRATVADTGTDIPAIRFQPVFPSTATSFMRGIYLAPSTAAATYTTTNFYGLNIATPSKGSGHTITNNYGQYINAQTSGSTLNVGLYVDTPSGASSNYAAIFAGGNVGIGTTGPITALHVDATTTAYNATQGLAVFQDDTDRQIVIGGLGMFRRDVDANADLRMNFLGYNGGTTQFRDFYVYDGKSNSVMMVDGSAGSVGIGTTSPGALLDLGTAGTTLGVVRLAGNTSGNVTVQPAAAAGTWTFTLPTTGGTNTYALTTNGSGTSTWSQIGLTTAVTGTLPVGNGGTGATTFTANGVLYGNTTSAIQVTAQGGANTILVANSGAPSFSSSPTIGGAVTLSDFGAAGSKNLLIGDDAFFTDVDVGNTLGLYGNTDSTIASLRLGSGGGTISGNVSGNVTITGTTTVTDLECTTCIDTGDLKTTTSEINTVTDGNYTLTGGQYSFYPQVRFSNGGGSNCHFKIGQGVGFTTYATNIHIDTGAGTDRCLAQNRYIQASPPYYFDNYLIKYFLYVLQDKTTNRILTITAAEDPPWENNGDDKNAVPHPFTDYVKGTLPPNIEIDMIDSENIEEWKREAKARGMSLTEYLLTYYEVDPTDITPPTSPETGKPITLTNQTTWRNLRVKPNADQIIATPTQPVDSSSNTEQADLAEMFPATPLLSPGDIVEPKLAHEGEIVEPEKQDDYVLVKTSQPYSAKAIGIISTNPAQVLNVGGSDGELPLALAGRVPVKVSTENGPIMIGDPLTSSSTPGVAMKATKAGAIVGKALEKFTGDSGQGTENTNNTVTCNLQPETCLQGKILAFVNISWYDPDVYLTDTGELRITSSGNEASIVESQGVTSDAQTPNETGIVTEKRFTLTNAAGNLITRIGSFAELVVATLKAGIINVQELIAEKITTKFVHAEQSDTKLARIEKLEMVDDESGEVYCVTISSGEFKKVKGGCQSPQPTLIPEAQTTSEIPTPSTTPLPTQFPVEIPTPTPISEIQIGGTATESAVVVEPSSTPSASPSAEVPAN